MRLRRKWSYAVYRHCSGQTAGDPPTLARARNPHQHAMNYGVISIYVTPVQIMDNQSLPNPPQRGPLLPLLISFPLWYVLILARGAASIFLFSFFHFFFFSFLPNSHFPTFSPLLFLVHSKSNKDLGNWVEHCVLSNQNYSWGHLIEETGLTNSQVSLQVCLVF